MKFSVADSGYIGWLFTARAVIIALISTALIILTVLVTVGTAIYRRDKRLAAEQDEAAESFAAEKNDGELPAIDAFLNSKISADSRKISLLYYNSLSETINSPWFRPLPQARA